MTCWCGAYLRGWWADRISSRGYRAKEAGKGGEGYFVEGFNHQAKKADVFPETWGTSGSFEPGSINVADVILTE